MAPARVTPTEKGPFAVLSVGGFLGMGSIMLVVPFSSPQVKDKQMVLPGASKNSLKALLPEFKYNTYLIELGGAEARF